MNILGALRSTYFHAALSIAGGAILVALIGLLGIVLQVAGLAPVPPTSEAIRGTVSNAVAILIFAIPIGAIHLWLVLRSLADVGERVSGPRHFFLNVWIVVGLLMVVTSIINIAEITIAQHRNDVAFTLAALGGGILVTFVAWRWREWFPAVRRGPQVIAAFVTLLAATVVMVTQVFALMNALLYTFVPASPYRYAPPPEEIWAASIGMIAALAMWWVGLRWLWAWRDVHFRTYYAAAGFLVGIALIAVPGSDALARIIGIFRGGVDAIELGGVWELPAVGLLLIAMHLPWLLIDRGRVGYPEIVTDRLISGITALGGLAALTLAATSCGSVLVQDLLRIGPAQPDPLRIRDEAAASLILGLGMYPLAWRAFLRSTSGDPRSGLRRLYVLFVIGAGLLGAIVFGVIAVTNLIEMVMGAELGTDAVRETIDAAGWAVTFIIVIAMHVWLLLSDVRAARALGPAELAAGADPMVPILEEVAAGRVPPRDAAQRIRALRSPFHLPGLP